MFARRRTSSRFDASHLDNWSNLFVLSFHLKFDSVLFCFVRLSLSLSLFVGTAAPCLSIFKPLFYDIISESLLREEDFFGKKKKQM